MPGRLIITGSCKRCGYCCKVMNRRHFMLDEKTGHCAYLEKNGECAIHEAAARGKMPPDIQEYWEQNCRYFPWYLKDQDLRHVLRTLQRLDWPPKGCGFKVEVDYG